MLTTSFNAQFPPSAEYNKVQRIPSFITRQFLRCEQFSLFFSCRLCANAKAHTIYGKLWVAVGAVSASVRWFRAIRGSNEKARVVFPRGRSRPRCPASLATVDLMKQSYCRLTTGSHCHDNDVDVTHAGLTFSTILHYSTVFYPVSAVDTAVHNDEPKKAVPCST